MTSKDEQRAKARERVRRWRLRNPERWQLLQLRSCAQRLRRRGFEISGGDVDLETLEPVHVDDVEGGNEDE